MSDQLFGLIDADLGGSKLVKQEDAGVLLRGEAGGRRDGVWEMVFTMAPVESRASANASQQN